ncbi:hypothetical protein BU17DRAFT_94833 [Hysterangium stoloniferum]|nr:hypothetical protein BU17DRAFT_94833 [Hysterangium stoloniferum]
MSTFNETTLKNLDMTTAETLQEGVEEPGQIQETRMRKIFRLKLQERWSCNEPGHDLCCRTLADDRHIPLSAKHVEVWVDELFKGDTSYNDLPTVVKMAGRPANTTSNHREGMEEQPPLVSSGELSSDQRDQIIKTGMRVLFRAKLRERWSCTETRHDLCYRAPDDDQHIPLSGNCVELCVDKLCQGEMSYHDPPTIVKISGRPTNTTSNHREGIEGDIPDYDQHIPLSPNDGEVRVDEMCQGETTYHDPPTVVDMPERCTNTTSDLREDVEELPPVVTSYRAPDDDQEILSPNSVEVSADEFKAKTPAAMTPTVVTMPERSTNTTSNLREGVEELPFVSPGVLSQEERDQIIKTGIREIFRAKLRERWSCNDPGHDLCFRALHDDQHISLSENHVEILVDELIVSTGMREVFRAKLRERWSSTDTGHDLCYRVPDDDQHIPLSANHVEIWVDQWCQGEKTYHQPPTAVTMPTRSTGSTSNLRPCGSHDSGCEWILDSISSIDIEREYNMKHEYDMRYNGPYHIRVALENVGIWVLHNAGKARLMARLIVYGRMVDLLSRNKVLNKFLHKSATLPRWGRIIQESIDSLRPTYPLQIQEQASRILGDFWLCYDEIQLTNNRDTMTLKLIASLGRAFICCPGVQWRDTNTSAVITSLLYNSLIKSPLHTNLDEISSAFVMGISRYLSDPDNQHPLLIGALADVIENVCHVRQLSVEELLAIRAYFETWLNQHGRFGYRLHRLFMHCVSQDTWFLNISGTVLNYVLRNIRMDIQTLAQSTRIAETLFINLEMLENFLDNKSLFTVHNSQLIIVGSFMVSILRHVPLFFRKYSHNQLRY